MMQLCALVVLALAASSAQADTQLSATECQKLGFSKETTCSDCTLMEEYVKDAELVADCKKCCTAEQKAAKKYTHARLEVCPYRLNGLPHIQAFLDKSAAAFKPALKVSKQFNAYPRLVLYNKEGGSSSSNKDTTSIRVDNWKAAEVEEYLRSMLVTEPAKTK